MRQVGRLLKLYQDARSENIYIKKHIYCIRICVCIKDARQNTRDNGTSLTYVNTHTHIYIYNTHTYIHTHTDTHSIYHSTL